MVWEEMLLMLQSGLRKSWYLKPADWQEEVAFIRQDVVERDSSLNANILFFSFFNDVKLNKEVKLSYFYNTESQF